MDRSSDPKPVRLVLLEANKRPLRYDLSVASFEAHLRRAGLRSLRNDPLVAISYGAKAAARLRLVKTVRAAAGIAFLVPLMGPAEYRLFPTSYFAQSVPYCFDCWPPEYARWEGLFARNRIDVCFFSANQAASYFANRLPATLCYWLPEATDPSLYSAEKPLKRRTIDVLELGRKYDRYHGKIVGALAAAGRAHLFELERGRVVFPTSRELSVGLGNSKISVCFPSSLTHPERSGNVETLTHRYLESMAAGCVIVGKCPAELRVLFGYDPVVSVDMADPAGQLEEILSNLDSYQALVARNYQTLLRVGTWEVRVQRLLELLAARGYWWLADSEAASRRTPAVE